MSKAAEITSEHREWLKENYAHLTNRQCRAYIGCGYERLKKLVLELGLTWKSDDKAIQRKKADTTIPSHPEDIAPTANTIEKEGYAERPEKTSEHCGKRNVLPKRTNQDFIRWKKTK